MPAPNTAPPLTAFDLWQARDFVAAGPLSNSRDEAARRVLAALLDRPWPTNDVIDACRYTVTFRSGFAGDNAEAIERVRIAEYVLATSPPPVVPGRGWIELDDEHKNPRFAFVEIATVAHAPKVLATVGVEAHAGEAVWAVRVAGRLADSYSRDNEQDLVLAQRRAEELVSIAERDAASANPPAPGAPT